MTRKASKTPEPGEADRLRDDANAARFWADEFSRPSLEEMVQNLYEYVVHWHRAADTLAGGPGRALALFPPPSDEEIRAKYTATVAEMRRRDPPSGDEE